jgi:ribulose-phosphate 3-epimerase
MTVNPGFGGQAYIPEMADKIAALVTLRKAKDLSFDIEVDGGIDNKTILSAKEAGANVFVAGSYLFKGNLQANVDSLKAVLHD